jgi:hypothetical protein
LKRPKAKKNLESSKIRILVDESHFLNTMNCKEVIMIFTRDLMPQMHRLYNNH